MYTTEWLLLLSFQLAAQWALVSTNEIQIAYEPKFTKGEKCIFAHLVLTFILILILIIIYGVHLYIVRHTYYGIFSTRRSSFDIKRTTQSENRFVGYLYLNITPTKFVCNTLLLKSRWSLCTAHCMTGRTDPDLAHLLFTWRLKYKLVTKNRKGQQSATFNTPVRRSIAHSLFDRETFANNVGLLEHTEPYPFLIPSLKKAALTLKSEDTKTTFIVGYTHTSTEIKDNDIGSISQEVHYVSAENCLKELASVIAVRSYEFCVTLQRRRRIFLDYGAVVFTNSIVTGIFSWGERLQKDLPMVVINITLYEDWLKSIVTL